MNISALIARLEALRAEHGDIVCTTESAAGPVVREAIFIPYEHDPDSRKPRPLPDGTSTVLIW